jgi:hypothetical protein
VRKGHLTDAQKPIVLRVPQPDGPDLLVVHVISSLRTETSGGGFGSLLGIGAKFKIQTKTTFATSIFQTIPPVGTIEEAKAAVSGITGVATNDIQVLQFPNPNPSGIYTPCPNCARPFMPDAVFCSSCGARVGALPSE